MALSIFCSFKFDTLDIGVLRRTATSESPRQSFHKFPLRSVAVLSAMASNNSLSWTASLGRR